MIILDLLIFLGGCACIGFVIFILVVNHRLWQERAEILARREELMNELISQQRQLAEFYRSGGR